MNKHNRIMKVLLINLLCLFAFLIIEIKSTEFNLNEYFWINRYDKVSLNIDMLLEKGQFLNNLSFSVVDIDKEFNPLLIEIPRDVYDISLKPKNPLEELEIKEIIYQNDEGEYLIYSFL